jgi:peptide/nickel transport system substrate-binding protein
MVRRRYRPVAIIASLALGLTACAPSPSRSPSTAQSTDLVAASPRSAADIQSIVDALPTDCAYTPEAGQPGGTATIGMFFSPAQLNPYLATTAQEAVVMAATMPTLMTYCPNGGWEPRLSAGPISFEENVKPDSPPGAGFTVHVAIRSGLRWSDGERMTLEDMRYTWEAVIRGGVPGINAAGWDEVDGIDVSADGLAADVHFKERYSGWRDVVGLNAILPRHYMDRIPAEEWETGSYYPGPDLSGAVTLGPYKYGPDTADDRIDLVRDPYWAVPADACGDRACLDGIQFRIFKDDKAGEVASFGRGELDLGLGLVDGLDTRELASLDATIGTVVKEPNDWAYSVLAFNEAGRGQGRGHPALQDVAVRRAIAQAMDKEAFWGSVFPDVPLPSDHPCTNAPPPAPWRWPDAPCPPFDVDAANKALEDAGYRDTDGDGVREMNDGSGIPLVFEHCTTKAEYRRRIADFIAGSLKAIGIGLRVNPADGTMYGWSKAKCSLPGGEYDTADYTWFPNDDPYASYVVYDSSQVPTEANTGGQNWLRFNDSGMDQAVADLKVALDPATQIRAALAAQQRYVETVPEVVLFYRNSADPVSSGLHNFMKNTGPVSDLWNVADWWLSQ